MALLGGVAALLAAGVILMIAGAAGITLLQWLRFVPQRTFFRVTLAVALGVLLLEIGFFAAQPLRAAGTACAAVLSIALALGVRQLRGLIRSIAEMARPLRDSVAERILAATVAVILSWEGLAAVAPLTGSDALHYHFAWPMLVLRNGFRPDFSLAHSFLTGEGHALIFAGLAFRSERLSLSLLFAGGALAAVAGAGLSREWVSRPAAWFVALAFLVTPVVFWQMTSAGAPDLWMSFLTVALVLCLGHVRTEAAPGFAVVCGVLAGGLAGAKYTGAILALVACLYFLWRARSARRLALFLLGALAAGVWPYARNFFWTGDPVFPFASRWLHSVPLNPVALEALRSDTGASEHHSLLRILEFPFFASVDPAHLGFWQFFGPLCLLFLPFFLFLCKRTALWCATTILVIAGGLSIAAASGMARFLLPLFPLALAAGAGGCAALWEVAGRWNRALVLASLSAYFALGCGGMLMYTRPAAAAVARSLDGHDYLRQRAPDYELCEFANVVLATAPPDARVLVFFRHVYYLRVPFAYGDPGGSWFVNPAALRDSQSWKAFFRDERIAYVLRGDTYPPPLAPALRNLEKEGTLAPLAEREVSNFEGYRANSIRNASRAVILTVQQ